MMKRGIGRIRKTKERDLLVYHENPTYLKQKDNEIFSLLHKSQISYSIKALKERILLLLLSLVIRGRGN